MARGGLTHQRAEGHDAEQPLQEDAEAVHERAALAAARAGRGGGRRPSRQRAARVPGGALHGPPGRPGRSGASLPRGRATNRGAGDRTATRAGSRASAPRPALRRRNPTSETAALDWPGPARGRGYGACVSPGAGLGRPARRRKAGLRTGPWVPGAGGTHQVSPVARTRVRTLGPRAPVGSWDGL